MRVWLLALLFAASCCTIDAKEEERTKTIVALANYDNFPFIYREEGNATSEWTGFLRPLLDALCEGADLECEEVYFSSLPELLEMVKNGTADFALHVLSATQERAQEVDFVRPFFYSSGVALYTFPEMGRLLEGAGGWEGLEGSKICLYDGYYASGMIQNEYNITAVAVPSKQAGAEAVRAGQCMAVAADAGQPTFGAPDLEQVASISPILTAPYAIPVAKGRTSLRHRLSAALVDLMQDGTDSAILQFEKEFLTDNGVMPNSELYEVVKAISSFE